MLGDYTFGKKYPKMHPRELEVFGTLKEVTGFISIQANHHDFTNLSFFRNLEVIGGRETTHFFSALYIAKTSLRSLNLRSLKRIRAGKVYILENSELCFASQVNWQKLIKGDLNSTVLLQNNKNLSECSALDRVCHPECSPDGCWGAGPAQCMACRNYRLGEECVNSCGSWSYEKSPGECGLCHEQCVGGCSGPKASDCHSCANVRNGPYCLPQCPDDKYDYRGTCRPCHPNCVGGCRGPQNNIGLRGCNSCSLVLINPESSVGQCLGPQEECPARHFAKPIKGHDSTNFPPSLHGTTACSPCHENCQSCSAAGVHRSVCVCRHYLRAEQCESRCPDNHYTTGTNCLKCSDECASGCRGPGPANCTSCRNYRLYAKLPPDNSTAFNCTNTCPAEAPYKLFQQDSLDPYCTPDSTIYLKKNDHFSIIFATIGSVMGVLTIVVAVAVAVVCRRNRAKEKANKILMNMMPSDDNEPLKPSNIKPNLAKLRIVKEAELRKGGVMGNGAFGIVYKGVWMPEDGDNVKIPVAIKVLREGNNVSREILEEAYIMASVDHPNLLSLLAVCMTTQIMMVTQLMPLGCLLDYVRTNSDKIGSKPLLSWCMQIARGMAYLEEHHLVHRDLAARNVLVQTPTCVKITDFGLAKLLDNEDEYKAAGGKMPIKWLALECIQHRIFTHKSDVWAFGVTVWEILSYGGRPYDKCSARDVPELLENGERLAQPLICSCEVYLLMLRCWTLEADGRPTFQELTDEFGRMAREPGRFLAVPKDRQMRLPSYSPQLESELIQSLASAFGSEDMVLTPFEEYLQPKYGVVAPSGGDTSEPITPVEKQQQAGMFVEGSSDSCFDDSSPSSANTQPPPGYGWDMPLRMYEDDYLVPQEKHPHYIGLDSPVGTRNATEYYEHLKKHGGKGPSSYPAAMDNPEYHVMNRRNTQALAAIAQNANILKIKPVVTGQAPPRNYHDLSSLPISHASNPSSTNSNRRKRSQRSSLTTSNPNTPTEGNFPSNLFNDPNISGLPKPLQSTNPFHSGNYSNNSNSGNYSNNSKPSTPTDTSFPNMTSFRTNELRPLSSLHNPPPNMGVSPSSLHSPPQNMGVPLSSLPPQNIGVPLMPNHSRISSRCSANSAKPAGNGHQFTWNNHTDLKNSFNNQNNSNYQFVNGLPTPNQSNEFLSQLIPPNTIHSQSGVPDGHPHGLPSGPQSGPMDHPTGLPSGPHSDPHYDLHNQNARLNGRPSSRSETTV